MCHDEIVLAENIIFKSYKQLFFPLEHLQVAPPLYLILQKFIISIFNYNILSFRFISILSGCMTLPLFYVLLKKNIKSKIALNIGLFIFAFNPRLIYFSNEFKPYITDVLFCIVLFLLNDKIIIKDKKSFFLYCLFVFVIPFCSFPAIIIMSAIIILKLIVEPIKEKLKYVFLSIPLVFSTIILLIIERTHYKGMTNYILWKDAFFNFSFEHNSQLFHNFFEFMDINSSVFVVIILVFSYREYGKKRGFS